MSTQMRIDDFFSVSRTSSNKSAAAAAKIYNAAKPGEKLSGINRTKNTLNSSKSGAAAAAKTKKKRSWERVINTEFARREATRMPEEFSVSPSPSVSATAEASQRKYFKDARQPDAQIGDAGVAPVRHTVKSYYEACKSKSVARSPRKLSLKRQTNVSDKDPSPLKKAQIGNDGVNFENSHRRALVSSPGETRSVQSEAENRRNETWHSPTEWNGTSGGASSSRTSSSPVNGTRSEPGTSSSSPRSLELKRSTEKMSLKRRTNVLGEIQSPPKKPLIHNDGGAKKSEQNCLPEVHPSNFEDDFPDDFDPAVVDAAEKAQIGNENTGSPIRRKVTPEKSSGSNGNSPWKVAYVIRTPDRSMTELSSDWEKTLGASRKPSRTPSCDRSETAKENHETPKSDRESNDETRREHMNRERTVNCGLTENSPRRALFSSPGTPKKVHFEGRDCRNESGNSPSKPSFVQASPLKTSVIQASPSKPSIIQVSPSKPSIIQASPSKPSIIQVSPSKPSIIQASPSKPSIIQVSPSRRSSHPPTTPEKTPTKRFRSTFSPRVKSNSPQKVRKERIDESIATRAVENMNQAKQGIIAMNDFDLETIYAKKSFALEYGCMRADTAIKYEALDVEIPEDKHADHFFMALANVFAEPMNCGYFDENELDTVFAILTLRPEAQSLLVRMLKRKRCWRRVNSIEYPEIGPDLTPFFRELVERGFFDSDIENEEISDLLNILQADEVRATCQSMKIDHKGPKAKLMENLVKLSGKNHSLFPGMKTPKAAVREKVTKLLGFCTRIDRNLENLLERIFILLAPTRDPEDDIGNTLDMLTLVHIGEKIFPPIPKERFPIFRNRLQLIRYTEARTAWNQIMKATANKEWEKVRSLGQLAYDSLEPYFENNDTGDESETTLPSHVKRFDANYVWTKVLSISVDAYKKQRDFDTAVKYLTALISERNKIPGNKIRWYDELALIEGYHRADHEASARITIEALERDELSDIDAAQILERAKKLLKRTKKISQSTLKRIETAVRLREQMSTPTSEPMINTIEARMVQDNSTGSKSSWEVTIGNDKSYMSVEQVALHHYKSQGYNEGLHCEGALPVALFMTLFWREIYEVSVPGVFVSPYQDAPLDLYNSSFRKTRHHAVEMKLKIARALDLKDLSRYMHEDFINCRRYQSPMNGNFCPDADDFKDLVECLGGHAVVGICERLAGNFNQWKSGFPDLVLWDTDRKRCKIVEVKGPGDTLSTKQRLWIQFLKSLNIDVEVCMVKGTTIKYST